MFYGFHFLRYPCFSLLRGQCLLCLSLLWPLESCTRCIGFYWCKFSEVFCNLFLCPGHQGCSNMFQLSGFPGKLFYLMVIGLHFSSRRSDGATWLTLASNTGVAVTHATFRRRLYSECTIHHVLSFMSQQFWKLRWAEMEFLLPDWVPNWLWRVESSCGPRHSTHRNKHLWFWADKAWGLFEWQQKLSSWVINSHLEMWCCHAKNLGKC